jgi:hypothetical protein
LKNIFIATWACLALTSAFSQVDIDKSCYVSPALRNNGKPIFLQSRVYMDRELQKEIGAAVKYAKSDAWIPLIYIERIALDDDSPALGNQKTRRAEIINEKVTGEYDFFQVGAGSRAGKYIEYKNIKNGKITVFQYFSIYDDCGHE